MRVLQYLAPHAFGGIESIVHSLVRGLASRNVEVAVAAMVPPLGPGQQWVARVEGEGFAVSTIAPTWNLARDAREFRTLVRRTRPDLIHCHGYRADILTILAGSGSPTISTVHGFTPVTWRAAAYEAIDRLMLRRFDRVMAVSPGIRARLIAAGVPPGRIAVVLNGIDVRAVPAPRAALRTRLGVDPDAFLIGSVGRLSPEKAQADLIEAFASGARRNPSWRLLLVGDGAERAALQQLAQARGLERKITFTGQRSDLEGIYPCLDLFVLPSHTEGSPTALLEAFGFSIPVVSTAVGAVPDMLQDGLEGVLIPPSQPEMLLKAMERLAAEPALRTSLATAGHARYQRQFTSQGWLERVLHEYAGTLAVP